MIRRRLTRLELQLDDTKEIDELLVNKPSSINQQQAPSIATMTSVTQNKHSNTDNELPSISDQQNSSVEQQLQQQQASYNPQPYQATNTRFQFNQSGQQLR